MNASVLPRRCSAMPVQLPTVSIGTVILSHCACAPRKAPLSRLLPSQKCSVLTCQAFGSFCEARPTVWCIRCAVNQLVMNTLSMPPWNSASR